MKMTSIIGAVCVGSLLTAAANAQTVEFEDLTAGDVFQDGTASDPFTATNGLTDVTISLEFFNFLGGGGNADGTATVVNPNDAGAGNGLFMGNTNLNFALGGAVPAISFAYANVGGNVNLIVNGSLFNDNDMSAADGTTLGGASVSVSGDEQGGTVTITGAITEFQVGGQEFTIDDVRGVPTPGAASVLALAGLAATRRRR